MEPFTWLRAAILLFLADLIAADATLDGAEIALFQNDVIPSETSVIGDFTIATYTGYAAEAVTWYAPSVSDAGDPEVIGAVGEFRPTAATVGNTIYGALLLDTGGALLAACRFADAPLPMEGTLDSIVVVPRIRLTGGGGLNLVS